MDYKADNRMNKHKFESDESFYCVKCEECVCISCVYDSISHKYINWQNPKGSTFTANEMANNHSIINKNNPCILSDDEWIIKQIIE